MNKLQRFWRWLDESNRAKLAFIGAFCAAILAGGSTVFTYYYPNPTQNLPAQFIKAKSLLNTGRYAEAKSVFEEILKISPNDVRAYWGTEIAGLKSAATIDLFKQALDRLYQAKPCDAYLNLMLGEYYFTTERNNPRKAMGYYQTAIQRNPQLAEAYFDWAVIYFEQQDWPAAQKLLENEAVQREPMPKYKGLLASVYAKQQRFDEALQAYSQISAYPLAALESARIYWLRENWAEAIQLQNKALAWLDDAAVMQRAENQEFWNFVINPANRQASQLIKPDEKKAYAVYGLAVSLYLQGDKAAADSRLAQLKTLDSSVVKAIVRADLAELAQVRPELAKPIAAFARRYLQSGIIAPFS